MLPRIFSGSTQKSLHVCFLGHLPKCLSAASPVWPTPGLLGVLLICISCLLYCGLHTFCFSLSSLFSSSSLFLNAFFVFPACTSVMPETPKIKDVSESWLKVQNSCIRGCSAKCCGLSPSNWAGDTMVSFGPFTCCSHVGRGCWCPTYMPLPFFLCAASWLPTVTPCPGGFLQLLSIPGAGQVRGMNTLPSLSLRSITQPMAARGQWLKNSFPLLLWQDNCQVHNLHWLPGSLPLKGGSSSCHTFIGCLPFPVQVS